MRVHIDFEELAKRLSAEAGVSIVDVTEVIAKSSKKKPLRFPPFGDMD